MKNKRKTKRTDECRIRPIRNFGNRILIAARKEGQNTLLLMAVDL